MLEFVVIVYFGFNLAFTLFLLTYNFDGCVFGEDKNNVFVFLLGIFFGMFMYIYSIFDNVTCSLNITRSDRDEGSGRVVRVLNDFNNFSL